MKKECYRCGRVTECHEHHPYRRMNNREETVPLCFNCHAFVHANPLKAKVLGLYKEMDGKYRGHINLETE